MPVKIWISYHKIVGYSIWDKFSDFQRPFKGISECFHYNSFCIELTCEWVDAKNLFLVCWCCAEYFVIK